VAPPKGKLQLVHRRPANAPDDPPRRQDDTQLLAAVRAGDPRAATAIYERSRPIVERTIARLLGWRDQDGPDISQQVMVEIVRSLDRYRGECPFDAWISTLTAHVVYKSLRRRQLERRVLADAGPPDTAAGDEPGRAALLRSIIARTRQHLGRIEPGRAWAYLLHDVHGYDLREMAEIMAISPAAAQSRLVRGRKELHDRLAADPELAGALERTEGWS
jgi:RNA polymerase sigma-70 factor (ECF subfamily)